jgi:hypothetical protein
MLSIARLFAAIFFGALLLAASSVVSLANTGNHNHHHSGAEAPAAQIVAADALEQLVAAHADCDREGAGHCCSCGQVACPMIAFACPEALQFDVPLKMAFSVEREQLLSPRDVVGLLKPPQAAAI